MHYLYGILFGLYVVFRFYTVSYRVISWNNKERFTEKLKKIPLSLTKSIYTLVYLGGIHVALCEKSMDILGSTTNGPIDTIFR